jgi:hypothetical protein
VLPVLLRLVRSRDDATGIRRSDQVPHPPSVTPAPAVSQRPNYAKATA